MNPQKAQAAIELAVFGAILVFILGTIIRSAVGNGYAQNENFKAMRMAMLASWQYSESRPGPQQQNTSHNSASVLFVEDRLSPDAGKYGDLDRNPFIAQGSGTFSYNLFYPWQPGVDQVVNLIPIMDVWINGQHFPFTTASYTSQTITRPASCPYAPNSCLQNQCLRNQREWEGGTVNKSQFYSVIPGTLDSATIVSDVDAIFNELAYEGVISLIGTQEASVNSSTLSSAFAAWLEATIPGTGQTQVNQIQSILQSNQAKYKLFYTMAVNGAQGKPSFSSSAADSMFDLKRLGDNSATNPSYVPPGSMRQYIAWQWSTVPGTTAASIGLNTSSNEYPQYDIDGRLKPVTIYAISQNSDGTPNVTYEDYQGGDIDGAWDTNSCGPKPGLQSGSQIFTFTKEGTYLLIKEGKLYNPETDQFVRSQNKRDTIDLIQRSIQLSNNTGRFCNGEAPLGTVANDGVTPNPVEVCVDGTGCPNGPYCNCFSTEDNIKSTCYDQTDNMIFARSRLQDLRGHFWMTNASGQLKVQ